MRSPHHRSRLVPMVLLAHHQETELIIGIQKNKIMKKVYVKPEMLAIELKQQGCLLAGSNKSVTNMKFSEDVDIIQVPGGIDDDDDDV